MAPTTITSLTAKTTSTCPKPRRNRVSVGSEVLGETQCPLPGSPEIPRAGEDGGGPVTQFDHLIGQRRRTCAVTDLDGSKRQIGLRDHGHPSARPLRTR